MAGPWDKYQPSSQAAASSGSPWAKYGAQPAQQPDDVVVRPSPDQLQPATFGDKFHDAIASSPFGHLFGMTDNGNTPQLVQDLRRTGARGLANVGEGAVGLLDLAGTPIRAGLNAILPADQQIMTGGQAIHQLVQNANPDTDIQPQGAVERYTDAANRAIGGALGGIGAGNILAGSANPTVAAVGSSLASNPGTQLKASITGSESAQAAKDLGASPTGQLLAGLAGGLAPSLASATASGARNAIGAALAPDADQQALAQQALQRGIPLKASQINGGKLAKYTDSVTGIVPFSGAKNFDTAQQGSFNQAVGKTIGADPAATKITPTVFSDAKDAVSSTYNDLWNRNSLPVNAQLRSDFQDAIQNAASAKPEVLSKIQGYWNRITSGVQQNGQGGAALPGSRFKQIDADMGRDSISSDPETRYYIGQLQDSLRDAMGSGMSQADQALLQQANSRWGAIKTLAPLVAKSTTGDISPATLQQAVLNNAAAKMAQATGNRGELGTLARIGQGLLKEPPQSGTEPRLMVRNFLGGLGSLGGAVAGGNVLGPVGSLATGAGIVGGSRAVQNLLTNPQVVARAAGVPLATPNYLTGIPASAITANTAPLLQQPQPQR